jgi:hypothetical protein
VVLENGKVVEQGTHPELYASKGRYFQMWEKQEQYNHGVLSITDLLIAENNARNAASELAYEKYNLLYNKTLIYFYCGR